ncbi:MAG: toll/interleukin-1 receptor domain-containing protein [Bryobacteraceae bacterium]
MANQEHLAILAKGVEAWNAWRRENPCVTPDLSGTHLNAPRAFSDSGRAGADLVGADLSRANLSNANLFGALLSGANLCGANLSHAFVSSILALTNLSSANLSDAVVDQTLFLGTNLACATFDRARMGAVLIADVDLSSVSGLETVMHHAPSTIGIDTIYRSQGKIPDTFLRGAGVPENLIAYMKSLTGAAFDFYSCFISYSTKDQNFAERLHADLQAKAVRCWFAPHDIKGGRKLHEQIDEAIRVYDKLLLLLSEHSMNSGWVKTEIAHARQKELNQKRQVLFPISPVPFAEIQEWKCFDADTGKDSAREIREYFIPDFSNWKDHDSCAKAFERLLRDLKAGQSAESKTDP